MPVLAWRCHIGTQGARLRTEPVQHEAAIRPWSFATRVSFRFCFVYFGLYCIATQIFISLFPIPRVDIPDPSMLWPIRPIILWIATHILRISHPVVYMETGSGDRTFDWILVLCLLVFAALATGLWSFLDRQREEYVTLYKWFRLFLRWCLAGQLLTYGLSKVIPAQMPFPRLTRLLEPFKDFSPMSVLWSSIGASPAYEMFTGCAEALGGMLLIVPRTTMLGALVCVADMIQVFMLNMTYDVPVKLLSFHLLLMALFLLAPEFERLADFFFRNRTVGPSMQPQLFRTRRANDTAFAAQIAVGILLMAMNAYVAWGHWRDNGGGHPKSPLYGIWNVEQLSIDGQLRSPLVTDYERWHRAVFDFPDRLAFQRMDDSFARYRVSIDVHNKTLALTKDDDKNWKARFSFQRQAQDELILDGNMDSHKIHMQLQLVDHNKFLLLSQGFHWIQESPFNR